MFEIICLSIAFIANSITIFFQEKELSKLRKRVLFLENDVLLFKFDESKRVSDAVPSDEH